MSQRGGSRGSGHLWAGMGDPWQQDAPPLFSQRKRMRRDSRPRLSGVAKRRHVLLVLKSEQTRRALLADNRGRLSLPDPERQSPTNTGSGSSRIPHVSCTPCWISTFSSTMSLAFASPRLISASACLFEILAGPNAYPLENPECSTNQAAETLRCASRAG